MIHLTCISPVWRIHVTNTRQTINSTRMYKKETQNNYKLPTTEYISDFLMEVYSGNCCTYLASVTPVLLGGWHNDVIKKTQTNQQTFVLLTWIIYAYGNLHIKYIQHIFNRKSKQSLQFSTRRSPMEDPQNLPAHRVWLLLFTPETGCTTFSA